MKLISIFHPGRCGSTILERVIAKSGVYHFGEVFRPSDNIYTKYLPDKSWKKFSCIDDFLLYLRSYAGIVTNLARAVNVFRCPDYAFLETKLSNYEIDPFASIAQIIRSESIAGGIFLYGQNYLRKYISIARARESGVWHAFKEQKDYQVKSLDIDFNAIHDPDILLLHHMPFDKAVSWYRKILTTQFEVIKLSCSASSKPFLSVPFEDIVVPGGVTSSVKKIFEHFGLPISSEVIEEAFQTVPLKRTGVDDLLSGLTEQSRAQFMSIPSFESYLPGGEHDLVLS